MIYQLAILATLAVASNACVYKFGTEPTLKSSWDFAQYGDNWQGTCATGKSQSPLNFNYNLVNGDYSLRTSWTLPTVESNGKNIQLINNGHVVQVEWEGSSDGDWYLDLVASEAEDAVPTDVLDLPHASSGTKKIKAMPAQFHFHTGSEHLFQGMDYPLEMHIVSVIPQSELSSGGYAVTGIAFKVMDDDVMGDNPALAFMTDNLTPIMEAGQAINISAGASIDFSAILPAKKNYYSYKGSLTTPPCSEGLYWHVFEEPSWMSMSQYRKIMQVISDKTCTHAGEAHNETETQPSSGSRKLLRNKMTNMELAMSKLPRSVEISASDLQFIRRDAKGELVLQTPALRSLLAEAGDSNYVCVFAAYSVNRRMPQPLNGRMVKYFAAQPSSEYRCAKSMNKKWEFEGLVMSQETIKATGFSSSHYALAQQQCKSSCDNTVGCVAFTYTTSGACHMYSDISGWVPAKTANWYDSCKLEA